MKRTLLLESVAGVAGDMFTASFVDAGLVDGGLIRQVPELLGLENVEITLSHRTTAGMDAMHLDVIDNRASGHTHYSEVDRLLAKSRLDERAKDFARRVYRVLAEAEAQAHGIDLAEVHFHEVGAVDSIVDVAAAGVCVSAVGPDRIVATPVKLGRGTIRIHHGVYPVPPPASARLAEGFVVADVPPAITDADVELSTPTGLAILRALSPTFIATWPAGKVVAQGVGCGTIDLGRYPNVFRVVLMEETVDDGTGDTPMDLPFRSDTVVEICCNIDDDTAERMAWVTEQLLAMGAVDVWSTPYTGKKGRAAVCLSVLSRPGDWPRLADWILRRTSTFGVRYRTWDRLTLERHLEVREVNGHQVSFKIGRTISGETLKEKPEHEDLRRIWGDEPDLSRNMRTCAGSGATSRTSPRSPPLPPLPPPPPLPPLPLLPLPLPLPPPSTQRITSSRHLTLVEY
jgi:uncharacterized protein (TIGR00299 family) protein